MAKNVVRDIGRSLTIYFSFLFTNRLHTFFGKYMSSKLFTENTFIIDFVNIAYLSIFHQSRKYFRLIYKRRSSRHYTYLWIIILNVGKTFRPHGHRLEKRFVPMVIV